MTVGEGEAAAASLVAVERTWFTTRLTAVVRFSSWFLTDMSPVSAVACR